jgi:hypothetical protein
MSQSSTPTAGVRGPSIQFTDNDSTPRVAKLGLMERAAVSSGPEIAEAEVKKMPLLAAPQSESVIGVSQERVVSDVPLVKAHSNRYGTPGHSSTTSVGVGTTQSIVVERQKARVQVNTEVASGLLVDTPTDSYPRVYATHI